MSLVNELERVNRRLQISRLLLQNAGWLLFLVAASVSECSTTDVAYVVPMSSRKLLLLLLLGGAHCE